MLTEPWLAVEDAEDEEILAFEAIEIFGLNFISFKFSLLTSIIFIESSEFFSFSLLIELDEVVEDGLWTDDTWVLVSERSWLAISFVNWLNESFMSISVCFIKKFADSWLLPALEEVWFVAVLWACMGWIFGGEFCFGARADLITKNIKFFSYLISMWNKIKHALCQYNIKKCSYLIFVTGSSGEIVYFLK